MLLGKKLVVVMPAYNAAKTLQQTYDEIPKDIVDAILLVDDCSRDNTVQLAEKLNVVVFEHEKNKGYGGNQKTCYQHACAMDADIVVMLHPDYQYTPKLIRALASLLAEDVFDVALGSRILGTGARKGGMPLYKYVSNRFLTLVQNLLIGQKLSEYHTGYRAFKREVLETLRLESNKDDFIFDNEMLVQCHAAGYRIAEVTCPTKYFEEASSINFRRSMKYGLGCLLISMQYALHRFGFFRFTKFVPKQCRPRVSSYVCRDPLQRYSG
jgi:glycosyltransferase involved in cell wall biosynthesis